MSDVGLIASAFSLSYTFSKPAASVLTDVLSSSKLFAAGLLVAAACHVLFSAGHTVGFLALCWSLNGLAQGFGWPSAARLMMNGYPASVRGGYWAIVSAGTNLGGAGAAVALTPVVVGYGWRRAFLVLGVASSAAAVALVLLLTDGSKDGREGGGEAGADGAHGAAAVRADGSIGGTSSRMAEAAAAAAAVVGATHVKGGTAGSGNAYANDSGNGNGNDHGTGCYGNGDHGNDTDPNPADAYRLVYSGTHDDTHLKNIDDAGDSNEDGDRTALLAGTVREGEGKAATIPRTLCSCCASGDGGSGGGSSGSGSGSGGGSGCKIPCLNPSTCAYYRRHVLSNGVMWRLSLAAFFLYLVMQGMSNWGVLFLAHSKGMPALAGNTAFIAYDVGGMLGSLASGRVARKSRSFACLLSSVLCLAGLFLLHEMPTLHGAASVHIGGATQTQHGGAAASDPAVGMRVGETVGGTTGAVGGTVRGTVGLAVSGGSSRAGIFGRTMSIPPPRPPGVPTTYLLVVCGAMCVIGFATHVPKALFGIMVRESSLAVGATGGVWEAVAEAGATAAGWPVGWMLHQGGYGWGAVIRLFAASMVGVCVLALPVNLSYTRERRRVLAV
jgi:sugar phosphate permease